MDRPTFDELVKKAYEKFKLYFLTHKTMPNFMDVFIEEFAREASTYYGEQEILQWLRNKGFSFDEKQLKINRERNVERKRFNREEKKYLPDGTYIYKGVRFGEPRHEKRLVELVKEHETKVVPQKRNDVTESLSDKIFDETLNVPKIITSD